MKYLLTSLLLVFLISCKKTEDDLLTEEVKGVVLNGATRQPITNYPVYLTVHQMYTNNHKNDEFPDGAPVFEFINYQTTTDANGHYYFKIKVRSASAFKVTIQKLPYYQFSPVNMSLILTGGDGKFFRDMQRELYDTIEAEKPAFIRFHINNTSMMQNGRLLVKTPHNGSWIRPDLFPPQFDSTKPIFPHYNWAFIGAVNKIIMDTVPSERNQVSVEWLHFLNDTLNYKKDFIPIQTGAVSDYYIYY